MYSQSAHKISGKNARALVSTCTCMLIFWRLNLRCAIRTYFQADRNFSLLICRLGYPLFHQHGTTHFRNLLQFLRKRHTQYLALTSVYTLHFLQIFFRMSYINIQVVYNTILYARKTRHLDIFFQCDVLDTFLGMQFQVK